MSPIAWLTNEPQGSFYLLCLPELVLQTHWTTPDFVLGARDVHAGTSSLPTEPSPQPLFPAYVLSKGLEAVTDQLQGCVIARCQTLISKFFYLEKNLKIKLVLLENLLPNREGKHLCAKNICLCRKESPQRMMGKCPMDSQIQRKLQHHSDELELQNNHRPYR